jgi:putative transposase
VASLEETERKARLDQARAAGLFRYSLVQEIAEPGLSAAQRGRRARELSGRVHDGPGGRQVTVSYPTLTRWRRAYEAGGFDALVPSPRQCAPRTPAQVLELAAALKRENPDRTAAQVRRILRLSAGQAPSDRTLQRLFARMAPDLPVPDEAGQEERALSRFECVRPNEMRAGDTLCRRRHKVSYADTVFMPAAAAE